MSGSSSTERSSRSRSAGEVQRGRRRVSARSTGARPGLDVILVGDDPCEPGLHAQQGEGLERGRHARAPSPAPRDDDRGRAPRAHRRASTRTPRSTASSCSSRSRRRSTSTQRPRRRRSDEGRRRLSPRQRRPPRLGSRRRSSRARRSGACSFFARAARSSTGARAVVVGRSNIVGKPVAQLLLAEHATVTIAHSRTRDLRGVCREADVLVAAVGHPEMIRGDWIKPGAVVIDVGINRVDAGLDASGKAKTRLRRRRGVRRGQGARRGDHAGPRRGRADDDRLLAAERAESGRGAREARGPLGPPVANPIRQVGRSTQPKGNPTREVGRSTRPTPNPTRK